MADSETAEKIIKLKKLVSECHLIQDEDRLVRKNFLIQLEKSLIDCGEFVPQKCFPEFFDSVKCSLLMVFNDPVEKCREISGKIVSIFIDKISVNEEDLALIMEALLNSLASPDERETSEEVRLIQINILSILIKSCGSMLLKHMSDVVQILEKCIVDPYPEMKRESCECARELAFVLRDYFHMVSGLLIDPLLRTITHQHFKTRAICVMAIGSVIRYGSSAAVNDAVSHLAQRLFDHSPPVRQAVVNVIGMWLVELPDRYSYFPQLLPLLLSALSDTTPVVRSQAEELWKRAGEVFLTENEKDYKDLIDFPKPLASDYPAVQPSLGCRVLVQKYFCDILPALINDMNNWIPETRVKSAQLLYTLLLHCEEKATMKLQKFLKGIHLSAKDDEKEAVEMAIKTAELVGYFVDPELWTNDILPVILQKPSSCNFSILAALIRGYGKKPMGRPFVDICKILSKKAVCRIRTEDAQANILLCIEALLLLPDRKEKYTFFLMLTSVAGLTMNKEIFLKAEDLLLLLGNKESLEAVFQLNHNIVKVILDDLIENDDLWTASSPELLIFSYLIHKSCLVDVEMASSMMPVIIRNLDPQKDPKLRAEILSLVRIILQVVPLRQPSTLIFYIKDLVRRGLLPNLVWSAGQTATALRAIALANVWEILRNLPIIAEMPYDATRILHFDFEDDERSLAASIGYLVLPILTTFADDDSIHNRLLACMICEKILPNVVIASHEDHLQVQIVCRDFLRCLDDESDDVRIASTKVFLTYFKSFPKCYDWNPWKEYVQYFYRNIIIHLDDKSDKVKTAIFELLKEVSFVQPEILLHEIESVANVMISSDLCKSLIDHVKSTFELTKTEGC